MEGCLFCNESFYSDDKLIYEDDFWRVVYDGFPCSKGHALIIPKRHIENIFESNVEFSHLFQVLNDVKKILDDLYHPLGYNIGINNGKVSGQTIPHLHIHVIPRYVNDGGLPCGVRNVFPPHIANYTNKK